MVVRIRQPFASVRRGVRRYACEFEIVRDGKTDAKLIYGIDAMQALLLTVAAISKELRPLATKRSSLLEMVDETIFPYAVVFADSTQSELRREVDHALMREEYRGAKRVAKRLGLDDED